MDIAICYVQWWRKKLHVSTLFSHGNCRDLDLNPNYVSQQLFIVGEMMASLLKFPCLCNLNYVSEHLHFKKKKYGMRVHHLEVRKKFMILWWSKQLDKRKTRRSFSEIKCWTREQTSIQVYFIVSEHTSLAW